MGNSCLYNPDLTFQVAQSVGYLVFDSLSEYLAVPRPEGFTSCVDYWSAQQLTLQAVGSVPTHEQRLSAAVHRIIRNRQ